MKIKRLRCSIVADLKRLQHKNPNHQRGMGYNEGLDNALVVVRANFDEVNNEP